MIYNIVIRHCIEQEHGTVARSHDIGVPETARFPFEPAKLTLRLDTKIASKNYRLRICRLEALLQQWTQISMTVELQPPMCKWGEFHTMLRLMKGQW